MMNQETIILQRMMRVLYAFAAAILIAVAAMISSISYDTHFFRIIRVNYIFDVIRDKRDKERFRRICLGYIFSWSIISDHQHNWLRQL